jgi:hypothetical protein
MAMFGSQVGMMTDLYSSDAPLFQRLVGPMRIGPLPFQCINKFIPGNNFDDRTIAYACFGGVPAYLETIDPNVSIIEKEERYIR